MKLDTLRRIMDRRSRLLADFRFQHMTLHDSRNVTAGKLWENMRDLEAECERVLREEYAARWIEKWPL